MARALELYLQRNNSILGSNSFSRDISSYLLGCWGQPGDLGILDGKSCRPLELPPLAICIVGVPIRTILFAMVREGEH